jgi:hypothetical protein
VKVLTIAANDLRRLLRWRGNLFFLFVLPMLIILLLGAAFGGSQKARIGVLQRDHDRWHSSSSPRWETVPPLSSSITRAPPRFRRPSPGETSTRAW